MSETEKVLEILSDMANGLEALAINVKHQIEALTQPKPKWDPSNIKWEQAEGSSGPYERSEDVNSIDFKEAIEDLAEHNGKLSRKEADGTWFYWKFQKSPIIGRKRTK